MLHLKIFHKKMEMECNLKKLKIVFVCLLLFFFCISTFCESNFVDEKAHFWLSNAYEKRREISSLAYLSTMHSLWDEADNRNIIPLIDKIINSKDTNPLVLAMTRNYKRYLSVLNENYDEAENLLNQDSFILDYLVLGPFPNENKNGLDEVFEPERNLDIEKVYIGKENRKITFRPLPKRKYFSKILLDDFVDPSENSVAYLVSFLKSDTEQDCVLRVSFSGAFKLFLNSDEVGSVSNYNIPTFDQYSFPVKISRGFNLLLIKTCVADEGFWQIRIRVTDSKGNPIKNILTTNNRKNVTENLNTILKKRGRASSNFKFIDPQEELKKRAEKGVLEKFEYALYLLGTKPFDKSEHKDLTIFNSILEEETSPKYVNYFAAKSESDFNRRRDFYLKSTEDDNFKVESFYELYLYYINRGMTLKALEYLNKAIEFKHEDPILKAEKLYLYSYSSILNMMANKEIEDVLEKNSTPIVLRKMYYLSDEKSFDVKERILKKYKKYRSDRFVIDSLFKLYIENGRKDEAINLTNEFLNQIPYDRYMIKELCSYEIKLGLCEDVEKILKDYLEYAPDWAYGREMLGTAFLQCGKNKEALKEFEKSLLLNPQNDYLKRRLSYLKPEEEPFYSTYKISESEIPQEDDKYQDQSILILVDNTFVLVEKTGLSSRYFQFIAKVQSNYGAQVLSSFPITFDPDWQEVRVIEATAKRKDGTKLRAESYTTSYLSDPQYQLYYRNRQLVLSFSGLKKGDVVSIEYLITDKSEVNSYGNYFGDFEAFQANYPILNKIYTLKIPENFNISYNGVGIDVEPIVVKTSGYTVFRWNKRDIFHLKNEVFSPGFSEISPYLHISTFNSWEELGKWYSAFIKDQWELSDVAKKLVHQLIEGKTTTYEKVEEIHKWVVSNTRYVGLEFGVHGYKPYKASQIFERRFGDCKDKALLLCSMLKEAKVEANMVLLRTRNLGRIEKKPASLASFNHAITYIPELDIFIDSTAEFSGLKELPYLDQGVDALIVSSDGKVEIKTIPQNSPDENIFFAKYQIETKKGQTEVTTIGSYIIKGVEAAMIRADFQNIEKQRETLVKQLSRNYPATKVEEATFSDMKDINSKVEISFKGKMNGILKMAGGSTVSGTVWMGNTSLSSTYCPLTERKFPLEIPYSMKQVYDVTYRFQKGATVSLPEEKTIETKFGTFKRSVKKDSDSANIVSEVILKVTRVEVGDYREFKSFLNEIDKMTSERILIKW